MPRHCRRRHRDVLATGITLAVVALWSMDSAAQRPTSSGRAALRPISSVDGKDLYKEYCAQCHGPEGKGDGPAAPALKTPPADLTQLAAKNGGKYSKKNVEAFIKGDRPGGRLDVDARAQPVIMTANGPDEMPVWGILFRHMWPDEPIVIRCGNLAQYVGKLQAK